MCVFCLGLPNTPWSIPAEHESCDHPESSKAQEVLLGLLLRCEYCVILILKTHSLTLTGRLWESTFITPHEKIVQARKIIPGSINGIPALHCGVMACVCKSYGVLQLM